MIIDSDSLLRFLHVTADVCPVSKWLDDRKLRKAQIVPDISWTLFVEVSVTAGRSRMLQGSDLSIWSWDFWRVGSSEILECFFEDLSECIVGGSTFRKCGHFGPCSVDKTTKIRREGLPVIWEVAANRPFVANQINLFILE